jgi:hypothetical protein
LNADDSQSDKNSTGKNSSMEWASRAVLLLPPALLSDGVDMLIDKDMDMGESDDVLLPLTMVESTDDSNAAAASRCITQSLTSPCRGIQS